MNKTPIKSITLRLDADQLKQLDQFKELYEEKTYSKAIFRAISQCWGLIDKFDQAEIKNEQLEGALASSSLVINDVVESCRAVIEAASVD